MIAIIDYDMGNLRSLENALDRLGATYCVTADPDTIRKADKVILPGVGHAGLAMDNLVERGLPAVIRSCASPYWVSAWACRCCAGIAKKLLESPAWAFLMPTCAASSPAPAATVPHMGWNDRG
jgi:Glutamine amidotransferase